MRKSFLISTVIFAQATMLGMLLFSGTGCAEAITYAKDARRDGLALYDQSNYVEAAAAFQNATRQDPRDYRSFYYLGCCNDQLKQYQQAIRAYRSSLETLNLTLEGQQDRTFRLKVVDGLALAIARSNTVQAETTDLERKAAASSAPEDYLLLARVNRYTQDHDGAIDAYNRATLLAPKDQLITKEYGLYLESISQSERAAVVLRRAYQMNEKDEQVAAALRRLGVIPGPAIKESSDLAQPMVPKGPIPSWDLSRTKSEPAPAPAQSLAQ